MTVNKQTEERQVELITEWTVELGWKTTTGQIRNEEHDGYFEGRSTYFIAANRRTVKRLPEQLYESNDRYHYLEQILDLGDRIFSNCFFTSIHGDSIPSGTGANIRTKLNLHHGTQTQDLKTFDATRVCPALVSQQHCFGAHAFTIEATKGKTYMTTRIIESVQIRARTSDGTHRKGHSMREHLRLTQKISSGTILGTDPSCTVLSRRQRIDRGNYAMIMQ